MINPDDARKYAPATDRNREAILSVLLNNLSPQGDILEIASGTGEHAVFFAPHFLPRQWIPSDTDEMLRRSIVAWQQQYPTLPLHPPLAIDTRQENWGIDQLNYDLGSIVNINMIHIAPFEACEGLMAGAQRILPPGGILYLYGPFKVGGKHTAPSNEAFDQTLQAENPQWGVRDLETVIKLAQTRGLEVAEVVEMPANNLSVVLRCAG